MANDPKAFTVWFTGIPKTGKSTLASALATALDDLGMNVEILDSGRIRNELNPDLGFSQQDIERSIKRLSYECLMLNRNGIVAIVASISPYQRMREDARQAIGAFIEVHCDAAVDDLHDRDPHGLFEKAQRGEVKNVAGVDVPYERPVNPEVHLKTTTWSVEDCLSKILRYLEGASLASTATQSGYTQKERQMIKTRLKDVGFSE